MSSENQPPENDRLRDRTTRLRELNARLLAIAKGLLGTTAESLEELDDLLEKQFGPEVWKRIYDDIPSNEKASSADNQTTERREATDG
jgi:hypothetical protein